MAKTADPGIHEAAGEIMDQYLYALGAGGAPQWVSRAALRKLRKQYWEAILDAVKLADDKKIRPWDDAAPRVLDYVRAIGQLAGSLSLADGRHMIDAGDIQTAIEKVELHYNLEESAGTKGGVLPHGEGAWCPPKG